MSDPVKIAAVQMVTSTNLEANLQSVDQLIREAAGGGAVMQQTKQRSMSRAYRFHIHTWPCM